MLNKDKYERLLKSIEDYRVQTDKSEFQPPIVKKAHKAISELLDEIKRLKGKILILEDRINELMRK